MQKGTETLMLSYISFNHCFLFVSCHSEEKISIGEVAANQNVERTTGQSRSQPMGREQAK